MFYRVALIGQPVQHSRSPELYFDMYKRAGVCGSFQLIELSPQHIADIRRIAMENKLHAFAVTMPHKQLIFPYLDSVSPEAGKLKSVNFVTIDQSGYMHGYNTDGVGFVSALEAKGISVADRKVLIHGCGGAAVSVASALQKHGADVYIHARNMQRVCQVCASMNLGSIDSLCLNSMDMFVNATPLGMVGSPDYNDFSFLDVEQDIVVCDLIYAPETTGLLHAAAQRGFVNLNGFGMLKSQAEVAFAILQSLYS